MHVVCRGCVVWRGVAMHNDTGVVALRGESGDVIPFPPLKIGAGGGAQPPPPLHVTYGVVGHCMPEKAWRGG